MTNVLIVPIHLDALVLKTERTVIEPMADFSRLPYISSTGDVNPDIANISEEILSQPFEDRGFQLKPGVHLHWALPDGLTRGVRQEYDLELMSLENANGLPLEGNGLIILAKVRSLYHVRIFDLTGSMILDKENVEFPSNTAFAQELDRVLNRGSIDNQTKINLIRKITSNLGDDLKQNQFDGRQISFPAVPNRWLVTRKIGTKEKQWVVESDYLYPPDQGAEYSGISYPYSDGSHAQPFRYMGRAVPLELWNPSSQDSTKYLPKDHPLTAVGYGEPTFAAFYPNCHSVFGFYDDYDNQLPTDLNGVQYDVIGWYANASQDCLNSKAFKAAIAAVQARFNPDTTPDAVKYQALQEHYQWWLDQPRPPKPPRPFPERTICYARLTFKGNPLDKSPAAEEKKVDIAVGNTSTEALSAYLAYKHAQPELEDQLEFLHLAPRLEGRTLDLGIKFFEARHEKEFTAVSGGTIWTIRPEISAPTPGASSSSDTTDQEQITLPLELAHLLNQLNIQQQAYDRDCDEIESMRKQLFADWYKYMLCAYPPQHHGDNYPDPDPTKYFIEKNSLFPLQRRIRRNKVLGLQCQQAVESLRQKVAGLASPDIPKDTKYVLKPIQAPRYWLPNEPVVLIADQTVQPTERHGQDGRLQEEGLLECEIETIDGEITAKLEDIRNAIKRIEPHQPSRLLKGLQLSGKEQLNQKMLPTDLKDFLKNSKVTDGEIAGSTVSPKKEFWLVKTGNREYSIWEEQGSLNVYQVKIGFYDWTEYPWHPFLLEWQVELLPLAGQYQNKPSTSNPSNPSDSDDSPPVLRSYDTGCIQTNYQLAEDAADLTIIPGKEKLTKGANIYKGLSILTPHAQIQLKQQINEFLEKELLSDYYEKEANKIAIADRSNDYFAQHRDKIIDWYRTRRNADEPFKQKLLNAFGNANQIPTAQQTDEYFANNRTAILQWYWQLSADNSLKKEIVEAKVDVDRLFQNVLIDQILKIKETLGDNFPALAQSLDGFNEALLMHKQTLQLPIDDPLGFADYRPFTDAVRRWVGNSNRVAPQPHNDFNPIRMGVLKILQLRLVDTFGQVQTLSFKEDQVITTDAMTAPGNDHLVVLPPRLAQPARLNFRWLSAEQAIAPASESTNGNSVSSTHLTAAPSADEVEMNDHPATTPICGWLVPNNLDSSLMVYDPQGQVLGSIDQQCQWFSAPGRLPITVAHIATINPYLHQLVAHIILQGPNFLGKFLTVVENVLEDIDPENVTQHEAIALLMARPIAVVRAKLDLEVQGLPAFDQEWNIFRQEVECELRCEAGQINHCFRQVTHPKTGAQTLLRNTQNFTQVTFPIRVGEHKQLNDGLVGFWLEEGSGYKDPRFYANDFKADLHASKPEDAKIVYYADDPDLLQSIDSDPIVLTMLVDPRGGVHATSGILPTKSIQIPPDQFVDALRRIEVMFLTAPILSDRSSIRLNLPVESGYVWSWVDKENGVWDTEHKIETVNPQAAFNAKQEIREGWLKLTQDGG